MLILISKINNMRVQFKGDSREEQADAYLNRHNYKKSDFNFYQNESDIPKD